jgi:hypothetical protein
MLPAEPIGPASGDVRMVSHADVVPGLRVPHVGGMSVRIGRTIVAIIASLVLVTACLHVANACAAIRLICNIGVITQLCASATVVLVAARTVMRAIPRFFISNLQYWLITSTDMRFYDLNLDLIRLFPQVDDRS